MKQFLQEYNMVFVMAAVGCLTIVMKGISALIYYRLLRNSQQMGTTGNKKMRVIIVKFETSYQLKRRIHNAGSVIKHYMYSVRCIGISIISWKNIGVYGMALIAIITEADIMGGIYYHMKNIWYLRNFLTAAALISIIAFSEILFQVRRKSKLLEYQMKDYLENTLQPKLENEYLHPEENRAYQMEYFDEDRNSETKKEIKNETEKEAAPSMEQLKIFEEMIEDCLSD